MFIKVTSIGESKDPIIIAVVSIQDVRPGHHGVAYGGRELGRIWLKGNLTDRPNYLTEETPEQIWEMLKPYVAAALVVSADLENVAARVRHG